MARLHIFSVIAASLLLVIGVRANNSTVDATHRWGELIGHSPFVGGSLPGSPAQTADAPEFRGLVCEAGQIWVNLYDPVARRAQWCSVPGSPREDLNVESYDPATDHLIVLSAGRRLDLALRPPHVSLPPNIAPAVIPENLAPALPGENEREAFVRQLPADVRQVLEQVKRRRMLREPYPGSAPGSRMPGEAENR